MLKAIFTWLTERSAKRARHLALLDLLAMDRHRLDDLGISSFDVRTAINDKRRALRTEGVVEAPSVVDSMAILSR